MNQKLTSIYQQVNNISINQNVNQNTQNEKNTKNQLQASVIAGLQNVKPNEELMLLKSILLPEPWSLSYCSRIVRQDLFCILQSLHPIRIELFGSTVMGIAFKGKLNYSQLFCSFIFDNLDAFVSRQRFRLLHPIIGTSEGHNKIVIQCHASSRTVEMFQRFQCGDPSQNSDFKMRSRCHRFSVRSQLYQCRWCIQ